MISLIGPRNFARPKQQSNLLDAYGNPIKTRATPQNRQGPPGMQIDGYALPDGATVSLERSKKLQNDLRNNSEFRERVEQADRETGTKSLHLCLLERGAMPEGTEDKLMENQKFGEAVMKSRIKDENLKRSKQA